MTVKLPEGNFYSRDSEKSIIDRAVKLLKERLGDMSDYVSSRIPDKA
jgi:hypothetical protein